MSNSEAFDRLQAMYASLYLRQHKTLEALKQATEELRSQRHHHSEDVIAYCEATVQRMEE